MYTIRAVIPTLEIIELAKMIQNLSLTLEKILNNISSTLKAQQPSQNSVARAVINNHITLDFSLN